MRKELRKDIYKRTRQAILPEWRESLASEIGGDKFAAQMLLRNTRVGVGQTLSLHAATRTRATVSGGLAPDPYWYLAEFGANPKVVLVKGRRGETRYDYRRKVNTGLKPRTRDGRYAYAAGDKIIKRVLSLWIQTTFRTLNEAFEAGEK